MHKLLLLIALLAIPLAGCDSSISANLNYDVELRSLDNATTVGTGELRFDSEPRSGSSVTGDFTLVADGGGPIEPLSITSGSFTASFEGDSLVVTILSPSTSDVGLRLNGEFDADTYAGTWSEITIAGPELRGVFTASAD
jgi:hypothetical protein